MVRGGRRRDSGGPRKNSGGARPGSGGPRQNSGGTRPRSGGPRKNSGGARPGSGGPRQNSGGTRPGSGGPRKNSGGARPGSGGPRQNSGGTRPHSGGPRQNSGGARPRSGGPRQNSGGARLGSGRRKNLTLVHDVDSPVLREDAGISLEGPVINSEEISNEHSSPATMDWQGSTDVKMSPAAPPLSGIFPAYCVWDQDAERARGRSSNDSELQLPCSALRKRRCGRCGDFNHRVNKCPLKYWTLRIFNCKYCGTVLMGDEIHGVCCGMKSASGWGVSFKRRHADPVLKNLYALRNFSTHSIELNSLFASAMTYMDLSFARRGGPSFLRMHGSTSIALPPDDSRYTFLWSESTPSLHPVDYTSRLIQNAVERQDIKKMVLDLYSHLSPNPKVVRERYRSFFSGEIDRGSENEQQLNEDDVIKQSFKGAQIGHVIARPRTGPLPDDERVYQGLQAYTVAPESLFRAEAPVAQIVGGQEVHAEGESQGRQRQPANVSIVKYKRLKASSKDAEIGAFPLLYPYGDVHQPFDMATHLTARNQIAPTPILSAMKVARLTWAENVKRRLYTDNVLLNAGNLFQQWLLRSATSIEDNRLQFMESQQRKRMIEERELVAAERRHAFLDDASGRLFLPSTLVNSPVYWREKRLDVQALVARIGPPSLFLTVTMNPRREELGRLGLDIQNPSAYTPQGDKPRIYDRPDLVARSYNQFINEVLTELQKNSQEYFGRKCLAMAAKLEFQQRNTPHHHILLWLEGGVLEDIDEIDSIISAELPRSGEDNEGRALVLAYHRHRHSRYCMVNGRCRFLYDENVVTPQTYIDATSNRVVYRRRQQEDLKIVPYNMKLIKRFRCHINVERAQTGHAVAYLMKYTFKPPEPLEVRVSMEKEERRSSHGQDIQCRQEEQGLQVRNDILEYKKGRVTGAVEAAWNLFEFRHVRIVPTVEAFSVHLPNERRFIISSPEHPPGIYSSPLERYMKRPMRYTDMDFLTYMESVKLYPYNKLPRRLQSNASSLHTDAGNKPMYVVDRRDGEKIVGRLRFVPPSNVELFSLRLIVLHRPMCSFEDARTWRGVCHSSFHEAAVAMGLYKEGDEFDKAFDEAVASYAAPSELRRLLVTLYQQGGDPKGMIQRHCSTLISDIMLGTDAERRMEMMRRVIAISDTHGSRLLREHPFLSAAARATDRTNTELQRARQRLHFLSSDSEARSLLQLRYRSLNEYQKNVLDQILQCVDSRNNSESLKTDGKVFFLQGHAGTGKTYLLSLLRDMAESRGILVEMTATTGIAASLYRRGRTLHSLLGIGIEEKDSSVRHVKLSKYGPRSERAELLRSLGLLVIDEASMMQRILFEHMDTVLKDLRCRLDIAATSDEEHVPLSELPCFGGLTVVFAGDYLQLLPVMPSRRLVREEDGNSRYIPVDLLDEIPWRSLLWKHVHIFRLTEQVRQAEDPSFGSLLMNIAKGLYPVNDPLPLQSTASLSEAYNFIWPWAITRNRNDVRLDRLIMCSTNALVDEHNENALKMFPGPIYCRPSATTIERLSKDAQGRRQRQQVIVPELTYNYAPTGVPPHMLKLKVGVPVMVVRNVLHPHLVNGAMFVVEKVTRRLLYVSELDESGNHVGVHVLHRITFQFEFADIKVIRHQFPVRLAFASTVHKGQGQTLGKLIVDLRVRYQQQQQQQQQQSSQTIGC